MKPILEASLISKSYGSGDIKRWVLKEVDVSFYPGEFVCIMGPSGSGKSTLLNIVSGLDCPTSGQVIIGNSTLSKLKVRDLTRIRRTMIGFVFQSFNLLSVLTVLENVALPLSLSGHQEVESYNKARVCLQKVGLENYCDRYPFELSGGQQQRVAIARAMSTTPHIIMADEPTGNLDLQTGTEILNELRRLCNESGQTIVMVTHDSRAAAYGDRILYIADGKVADEFHIDSSFDNLSGRIVEITSRLERIYS